jgi:hypothetical protein
MTDKGTPGWFRDEWGEWHGPSRDLGNAAPHDRRPPELPPHLRPAVPKPFVAAFTAETATDASPEPAEARRPAVQLPAAESAGGGASDLGRLMDFLRSLLPHEDTE